MEALDSDLVATALVLVRGRDEGLCSTLALLPVSDGRKGGQACDVVIDPARVAMRGEVLRVYDGCSNSVSERLHFRDLLSRDLLPSIVGWGKCRVVWEEFTECRVILPGNPDNNSNCGHGASSILENASPSA